MRASLSVSASESVPSRVRVSESRASDLVTPVVNVPSCVAVGGSDAVAVRETVNEDVAPEEETDRLGVG